jgi:hypothetical protein
MRFRDTNQRVLVCRTLFDLMGLGDTLWCPEGPTQNLEKWLTNYGGSLSVSQAGLYEVALGIWNGSGGMPFNEMLRRFEDEHLKAIGSLLIALATGPEDVDQWITVWAKPVYAVV